MNRTNRKALSILLPLASLTAIACEPATSASDGAPPVEHTARVSSALTGNIEWSKSFSVTSHGDYEDGLVAVDGAGNSFVRGYFTGHADFGNGVTLDIGGEEGPYLLKVDPNGNALWARYSLSLTQLGGVATDAAGNVYIATGSVIDSFDPSGTLRWSKDLGAGISKIVHRSISGKSSLLVGGLFSGTMRLDATTSIGPAAGVADGFVVQLRDDGAYLSNLWITDAIGATPTYQDVGVVDAAPDGSWLVGGFTYGSVAARGFSRTAAPGTFGSGYLLNVKAGSVVWSKQFGGASASFDGDLRGLAFDNLGNVIATGPVSGSPDLGGGPLVTQGYDTFIAKYDGNGVYQWAELLGGSGADFIYPPAVDAAGNILIPGIAYSSPLLLAGQPFASGSNVPYLAKLDGITGGVVWTKVFSGTVAGLGTVTGPSNDVFLTFVNYGTIDLGAGPLSIGGGDEARVVARFLP